MLQQIHRYYVRNWFRSVQMSLCKLKIHRVKTIIKINDNDQVLTLSYPGAQEIRQCQCGSRQIIIGGSMSGEPRNQFLEQIIRNDLLAQSQAKTQDLLGKSKST